jgi:hypothetical protein
MRMAPERSGASPRAPGSGASRGAIARRKDRRRGHEAPTEDPLRAAPRRRGRLRRLLARAQRLKAAARRRRRLPRLLRRRQRRRLQSGSAGGDDGGGARRRLRVRRAGRVEVVRNGRRGGICARARSPPRLTPSRAHLRSPRCDQVSQRRRRRPGGVIGRGVALVGEGDRGRTSSGGSGRPEEERERPRSRHEHPTLSWRMKWRRLAKS